MPYMVTFTINIPQMLVYIPYMDPMSYDMAPNITLDGKAIGMVKTQFFWMVKTHWCSFEQLPVSYDLTR